MEINRQDIFNKLIEVGFYKDSLSTTALTDILCVLVKYPHFKRRHLERQFELVSEKLGVPIPKIKKCIKNKIYKINNKKLGIRVYEFISILVLEIEKDYYVKL